MSNGPWDDYKDTAVKSSGPWDDFKSNPQELDQQTNTFGHNVGAAMDAVSDFAYGIPKFFAQAALAGTARGVGALTGNKATLNDTWKAAGDMINEAAPSLGSQDKLDKLPGYTVPNYPFQKFGEAVDYAGDKAADITGSGDIGGGVKIAANFLPVHLIPKGIGKLADRITAPSEKVVIDPTKNAPTSGPWDQYQPLANQSDLPGGAGAFDNIRRQVSGEIQPSQDITNTPMERMTDTLLNGRDQAATTGAENAEGSSIAARYWQDRAREAQADEIGNRDANAADIREHLTQPDTLAQRPLAVDRDGNVTSAADADAMARANEGISYEAIPPDGSIPGNSPTRGISVPRNVPERWVTDENGIPVRQGLPGEPDVYPTQDASSNTPHANDLGNAIQEANGPKLGPDEHYGAGMLEADRPTPPRRYKNSQRGSVDGSLLYDAVNGVKKWFTGSPEAGRTKSYSLEEQAARKNAELQHAGPGQYITQDRDLAGVYGGPTGRAYEVHEPFKQPFDFNTIRDWGNGVKQSGDKVYKHLVEKLGSKSAANAYLKKSGFDAITFTSPRGERIANVFNSAKLSDIGPAREPTKDFGELSLVPKEIGTPSDKFNVALARAMRGKGSQAGVIDGGLVNATHDLIQKAAKNFEDLASKPLKAIVGMLPEDHMARVSGLKDMIYKPKPGTVMAKAAEAQGQMNTKLWKNVQSGMALAGEKNGSLALKGAADWLHWTDKRTHLDNKKMVDPFHKDIRNLNEKDFIEASKVIKEEQLSRTLKSPEELSQRLSPEGVKAYNQFRQLRKDSLNRINETNRVLGKDPITEEAAGHASVRQGDWKQPIFAKNGQLLYQFAHENKLGAIRATNYLKKMLGDKIDWDRSEAYFGPEASSPGLPRDIMGAYQNMLSFFPEDSPVLEPVKKAIDRYNAEHGYKTRGFDARLMDKRNIPGFEGDKPWLSDKENAKAFWDSQIKYFRDTNNWSNFQEALANLKPLLNSETLVKNQKNIMNTIVAHVNRELGINGNKLAAIEAAWAKYFPKVGLDNGKIIAGLGTSRGSVYKGVADVKMGTYLTMLGFNIPYMLTTPLQAAMSVAQHRALTVQGFDHNIAKTTMNSIADISAGLARHMMGSMTGKDVNIPMSSVGKRMLQYAEDNGLIDKTVLDETGGSRPHAVADFLKKTAGATISAPEKVARWSTFVAFAHHLLDSGKLSEAEAFKMAEDFTNHSLTSMRRSDRPLIVDKLGTGGQLGYVFKSYLFNEYNQLSQLAQMKNKSPLALHAAMLFALGGALALPGINELSDGYDLFKTAISKLRPQSYSPDIGIKGAILRDLPTWASIGTVSDVTGTNIGTRFNTQIGNVQNPLSDVAVPIQEGREIMSIGSWAMDPTMRNAWNALHANVGSTLKGQIETHADAYKSNPQRNPDGTQSYLAPRDINGIKTDYKRTPQDEAARSLGMYSDTEYKTKQLRYANDKEAERQMGAFNKLATLAMRAGEDGDKARAQALAGRALQLLPDRDKLSATLNKLAEGQALTPEERDIADSQENMLLLQKVKRLSNGSH